jgi:hypothetical protein
MQPRTNCCTVFVQPCSTLRNESRCAVWRFREVTSCSLSFTSQLLSSEALHGGRQLSHMAAQVYVDNCI